MTSVLVEKYRPKKLNDVILSKDYSDKFSEMIKNKKLGGHLLFYGGAGRGKTTVAKILANEITSNILFINASDERGIDTIRNKIIPFASMQTMFPGEQKIIIMDECLDENEEVLILDENKEIKYIKLKDLDKNKIYKTISMNVETRQEEIDELYFLNEKEDKIYEVELDDGRKIKCTLDHSFMVEDKFGNVIRKKLKNLNKDDEVLSL
jgi:adenylate kinase family enzyme